MAFQPLFIRGWKQLSAYKACLLKDFDSPFDVNDVNVDLYK